MEKMVNVTNRNNGFTGYTIPDTGITRSFNIDETKNYHTLKLHIIKQKDENKDIDYMYKILYKPINTKGIYKHIKIKKHEFKDPELEGDELISLVYDLMLWCISHGHLPSANKN